MNAGEVAAWIDGWTDGCMDGCMDDGWMEMMGFGK